MISRKHRFHGHNSLSYVYKNGQVIRSGPFLIKYCQNPRRKDYRIAVVVSKKVHKSAVVRNRIRRRIYEIVRTQIISAPFDIVFVVFDEKIADMPTPELRDSIEKQFSSRSIV